MDAVQPPSVGNGIWSFAAQGTNEWFGPGRPLTPVAQDQAIGRAYDFATGYNYQTQPKPYEGVTFRELRSIADGYDLLRLVIETRKDQLEKLTWTVKKRGEKVRKKAQAHDPRIEKIIDFLTYPDQEHTFGAWIRMLVEDLFVLDAPAIYVRRTKGGGLFSLEPIDGATIKRILDPTGRTPLEGPAYQQVIKGVVACQYTRDELIYMPRNARTHRAFGFSPVEQIVTTVNIALRRQLHQLSYYTDGNTPNLIFGVPKEWTTAQIKTFQEWWDSLMAGNSAQRQRARFVPGEVKPFDTKEHALKDEYDEWLARIVCFAFSVAPSALVKDSNRATAETVQINAWAEGQAPTVNWLKSVLDRILRDCFDAPDLEAVPEDERSMEPLVQSQRDQIDIASGVREVNECREDRGLEPLPEPDPVLPPPPPPPGNVATPEGQPALPDKNQPAAASTEAGDTSKAVHVHAPAPAALTKAKKKVMAPIKRDRGTLKKLEAKLKKVVSRFLKAQVQPIAELLHGVMPESAEKLAKMSREEALAMLEAVDFDWTKLGDDLEPILAAIAQDGAAQGLVQVGSKMTSDLLDQVNEKAVEWAEKHAADLVTQLTQTTRDRIRGDLAASIELGMSVQDIAKVLEADYEFSEQRAELIATTERAFADVRGNQISYAESGVVGGLEWITANGGEDDRTCADCELNDGAVVPMDEDGNASEAFPSGDTTVPAHPGCFISGTVVSAFGVSKHFKRWFTGEVVTLCIEGNDDLTATPNHPILTRRGWVAAAELHQGDEVIKCLDPKAAVVLLGPDNHHVETRIEDMADALIMTGSVSSARVPTAPEDFHGDGLIDHDVDVVWADGCLGKNLKVLDSSGIKEGQLQDGLIADSVRSGDCATNAHRNRLGLASDCCMSEFSTPGTFNGADSSSFDQSSLMACPDVSTNTANHIANRQAMASIPGGDGRGRLTNSVGINDGRDLTVIEPSLKGFGRSRVSDGDAVLCEDSDHDFCGDTKILRDLLSGFSGLITTAKVVSVRRNDFSGHVFNFQTVDGWYFANSIIAHNCLCDLLPVLNDDTASQEA